MYSFSNNKRKISRRKLTEIFEISNYRETDNTCQHVSRWSAVHNLRTRTYRSYKAALSSAHPE